MTRTTNRGPSEYQGAFSAFPHAEICPWSCDATRSKPCQSNSKYSVVSHASRKKEHHGEGRSRAQAANGTHTRLAIYDETAAAVVCLSSALPVTGSGRAVTGI